MTDNDRTAQLERACSYLRRIPAWYLATTDVADGYQPRVRPFSFAMVDDGKLWFCTSRDKDVWAELSANPKFELSGWKPGECWIVLTGEAALEDDAVASDKVRQAGFKHMVGHRRGTRERQRRPPCVLLGPQHRRAVLRYRRQRERLEL